MKLSRALTALALCGCAFVLNAEPVSFTDLAKHLQYRTVKWASPNRVLYTEAEHDGGWDTPIPTGELYAVNADGGGQEMLYGYRKTGMETGTLVQHVTAENGSAQFLSRMAGDPDHVLVEITDWEASGNLGNFTTVYKMDVRDGRKVKGRRSRRQSQGLHAPDRQRSMGAAVAGQRRSRLAARLQPR